MYLANTKKWYLERVIWLVAGFFTLLSAVLVHFFGKGWLIFTAIIGFNLMFFAITGYCTMANILYKLGFRSIKDE
ncbi:MAG: DUF2892 domain-containing protein [Negativicutes bacterium]|nr:DUF2892 domain-containing protein [Negativicutes bacterium]